MDKPENPASRSKQSNPRNKRTYRSFGPDVKQSEKPLQERSVRPAPEGGEKSRQTGRNVKRAGVKQGSEPQSDERRQKANRQNISSQRRTKKNPKRRDRRTRKIKIDETYDDIKKDVDRIEKEIWLEIADVHTIKLDS